jgi:hypothetical protein
MKNPKRTHVCSGLVLLADARAAAMPLAALIILVMSAVALSLPGRHGVRS